MLHTIIISLYDFLWLYYYDYSWFLYDLISFWLYHAAVKKAYIANNICSRKSATTFGDLPDCSGADKRKHQSSASLAFVPGIAQMASNAENVSVWWRHQVFGKTETLKGRPN